MCLSVSVYVCVFILLKQLKSTPRLQTQSLLVFWFLFFWGPAPWASKLGDGSLHPSTSKC